MRILVVCWPWVVRTWAQRCWPSGVLGPVDLPPWNRHLLLPDMAGALHCKPVRFERAWHRSQVTRPPSVWRFCSKCKVLGIAKTLCVGLKGRAGNLLTQALLVRSIFHYVFSRFVTSCATGNICTVGRWPGDRFTRTNPHSSSRLSPSDAASLETPS